MKTNKLSTLFVIRKANTNKDGLCAIYCRITYNKKRIQFSTGERVKPRLWDSKQQRVKGKLLESIYTNTQLDLITSHIKREFLALQLKEIEFTVNDLYNNYMQENNEEVEVMTIAYFQDYLKRLEKLIDKDIKLATWKKYDYSCKHVASFIKWKYKKHDYPIRNLKLQFLSDLEYYLKTEANHNQATLNKIIQRFRKPVRIALGEGILDKDPFYLYKAKHVKKDVVFLDRDELKRLENHSFSQSRLTIVRDLFIFCCYTGLAYREMNNLEKKHIVKGIDNRSWIQIKREKTNGFINVPILPKAQSILNKYKTVDKVLFPNISNQKVNSYLKEIAYIVGIEKRLTHHVARKTFATTILLNNEVPMEIVSKLLGHSSIKITENHYINITNTKIMVSMRLLEKKLGRREF